MTDDSRAQGGLICVAVVILGALFVGGLLARSYWAIALPVAVGVGFVLSLAFWVGWTIATVRVEPEAVLEEPEAPAEDPTDSASSPTQA
ncbi:MAG: hypothetical protein ABFS46_06845 [Myxococcota bacterium]